MTHGLLDTSLVIELVHGRADLTEPPDDAAISTVTLCELHHGLLRADDARRPGRLAVLAYAERTFRSLPVDAHIAPHYGRMMTAAQDARGRRLRVADALIAATATAYGLTLYTRDRDFEGLPGLQVVVA